MIKRLTSKLLLFQLRISRLHGESNSLSANISTKSNSTPQLKYCLSGQRDHGLGPKVPGPTPSLVDVI